ncbi:voltage-gated potassium channel [Meredithblackwellia eburnea MCA 4105]
MYRLAIFAPAFLGKKRRRNSIDTEKPDEDEAQGDNNPRAESEADSNEKNSRDNEDEAAEGSQTGKDKADGASVNFPRTDSMAPTVATSEPDEEYQVKHRYLPIFSGLVCPFSVLLDIPGLTERWYIKTEGYDIIETQPNPIILDIGLAFSVTFGIIANAALITRFLERKPRISTLIAIGALTVHDLINVVTVIIFGVIHRFNDGFTYGTAYWMCVAATVASLSCNVTLIFDYASTKDFVRNGSGLTEKQRSLVVAVMALLCYIGLGSLVFSFLMSLTYINSMYFTIVTITSCGFGDLYPTNVAGRVFSFFYDVAGLVLIAFTIALARETVIETFEASYRRRRERLAEKAKARKEEKRRHARERKERRERELKEMRDNPNYSLQRTLTNLGGPGPTVGGGRGGAASARNPRQGLSLLDEVEESGVSAGKALVHRLLRKWGFMKPYKSPAQKARELGMERSLTQQSMLGEDTFKSFKKEMEAEQAREFRLKIGTALTLFWSFWLIGSMVFSFTEKWTYFEGMWFCFIFFTTIGYGDFSPKSSAGRAFFVAWSMLGIATMTLLLSVVTETWSSRYKSTITQSKVQRTIRRVRSRSVVGDASTAMSQLLAIEGYGDEDTIDPKDLPKKLTDAVRGFHDHARYFMLGRTGDPPPRLRLLVDASDELEEELSKMKESGDLAESGATDTRHFLFMVSYERHFDALMEAAEQLNEVFRSHSEELETMRGLNEELRAAVHHAKTPERLPAFPFGTRRPMGGDGDENTEEQLIKEIDGDDDEDAGQHTPSRLRAASVADTLKHASSFIKKLQTARNTRITLTHRNSGEKVPTLSVDTQMTDSSPLTASTSRASNVSEAAMVESPVAMNRQGTLTFSEPPVITRNRSTSSIGRVGEGARSRLGSTSGSSPILDPPKE